MRRETMAGKSDLTRSRRVVGGARFVLYKYFPLTGLVKIRVWCRRGEKEEFVV